MLDIAGAWFLAMGIVMKKPDAAIEEATGKYDFNPALEASLAAQTADAQVGAVVLTAGFGVQMAAALGWHEPSWCATVIAILVGVLAAAAAWLFLHRYWRPRSVKRALVARLRAFSDHMGLWMPALLAYGQTLRCPWRGDPAETQAEYGERLVGRRRWAKLLDGIELPELLTKRRSEIRGTPEYWAGAPGRTQATRRRGERPGGLNFAAVGAAAAGQLERVRRPDLRAMTLEQLSARARELETSTGLTRTLVSYLIEIREHATLKRLRDSGLAAHRSCPF